MYPQSVQAVGHLQRYRVVKILGVRTVYGYGEHMAVITPVGKLIGIGSPEPLGLFLCLPGEFVRQVQPSDNGEHVYALIPRPAQYFGYLAQHGPPCPGILGYFCYHLVAVVCAVGMGKWYEHILCHPAVVGYHVTAVLVVRLKRAYYPATRPLGYHLHSSPVFPAPEGAGKFPHPHSIPV